MSAQSCLLLIWGRNRPVTLAPSPDTSAGSGDVAAATTGLRSVLLSQAGPVVRPDT
jgi:hypothetical protein